VRAFRAGNHLCGIVLPGRTHIQLMAARRPPLARGDSVHPKSLGGHRGPSGIGSRRGWKAEFPPSRCVSSNRESRFETSSNL
jgi:hypothetical protein